MTRNDRRAFWYEHVTAWRTGDTSQAAYCRHHGLSPMTFSQWKRRFEHEQVASAVSEGTAGATLVEVQMGDEPAPVASGITVELSGDVRLQLGADFEATALKRAVAALTDAGG